jgi:hypothetical protein
MISAVETLCESASFVPGDRVQTLRGTTAGRVVKFLEDGRVVWAPQGGDTELISLPEGLKKKFIPGVEGTALLGWTSECPPTKPRLQTSAPGRPSFPAT